MRAWTTIRKRLTHVIIVLLLVSFGTLLLSELIPGDPVLTILGENATPEQITAVRHDLRLDQAIPQRYVTWLGDVFTGDLGRSVISNRDVADSIRQALPITLELAIMALVMALAVAVPLAMYSAYRANGIVDRLVNFVASTFISTPSFLSALVLVFFFSLTFRIFPVVGWVPLTEDPIDNLRHAFLPALTLALTEMAVFTRLLRSDMIATLQEDFIVAARAKGLPTWYLLLRHALRPSSFSLLTLAGLSVGRIIGGAVVVERIFALPGVGSMAVQAILNKDLPSLQGVVIFVAVAYVVLNLLVDTAYSLLDPRVRAGGRS